ncbi:MAG: hypothetical protein ACLP81_05655 [Acidimicrobiales bacterium]
MTATTTTATVSPHTIRAVAIFVRVASRPRQARWRSTTSTGDHRRADRGPVDWRHRHARGAPRRRDRPDHPDGVTIVGLLKGSVFLVADLVRGP